MATAAKSARLDGDSKTWGWGEDAVLPLTDLFVEYFEDKPGEFYQRPATKIERLIFNNYDPLLIGRLIVARVTVKGKTKYAVLDGATRLKALSELGISHAPCVVLEGLSLKQRAEKFIQANTWSKTLRAVELFRAKLASGDEAALAMQRVFDKLDIVVVEGAATTNSLAAIHTAAYIYNEGGEEMLERTLTVIKEAWPDARRKYSGAMIGGIGNFLMRDNGVTSGDKLIARLASLELADVLRQASDLHTGAGHGGHSHIYVARGVAIFMYGAKAKTAWPKKETTPEKENA